MALAVLIPLAAFGILLAIRRAWLPDRSWWVVIALQGVLVGGGFLALQSGERDEERAERVVSEASIEAHEHAAQRFELGAAAVLGVMLLPVLSRRRSIQRGGALLATAGTLAVAALGVDVGHRGGELVYKEGAANAYATPELPPVAAQDDDDDD
jgi:hypothetical protein